MLVDRLLLRCSGDGGQIVSCEEAVQMVAPKLTELERRVYDQIFQARLLHTHAIAMKLSLPSVVVAKLKVSIWRKIQALEE